MIEVGKLYSCSEYFLLLFPDKETAAVTRHGDAHYGTEDFAVAHATYWTRKLGKSVSYCNPQTPLLVLSVKEKYIEVLAGEQKGWIIYPDWLNSVTGRPAFSVCKP